VVLKRYRRKSFRNFLAAWGYNVGGLPLHEMVELLVKYEKQLLSIISGVGIALRGPGSTVSFGPSVAMPDRRAEARSR